MEYLFTERAHLMCPNMCFGMAAVVNAPYNENLIKAASDKLSAAHPFLNALLGYEEATNRYFYNVGEKSQIEIFLPGSEISGISAPEFFTEYQRLTAHDWNLFAEGMLKITAWKTGDKTCFLFAFHHLLADGRGALELVREFADLYATGVTPVFAKEKLISSADEFPADSRLPFISRVLVNRANRQWLKENQTLSYEKYHAFANEFLRGDTVKHNLSVLENDVLSAIIAQCHENDVTVNDYLLAKLFAEEKPAKIIMACDLRPRLACYNKGALGNYSTAFSVVNKNARNRSSRTGSNASTESGLQDIFTSAKLVHAVHSIVQKKMKNNAELYLVLQCYAALEPGLLDAAFMASQGAFKSKSAEFIGKMFFGFAAPSGYSITNLGKTECSSIESAFFIPPASPAIKKTLGVLTVNGTMRLCTSER
nr:hypothetical protein [Treponemataceae bacterium]